MTGCKFQLMNSKHQEGGRQVYRSAGLQFGHQPPVPMSSSTGGTKSGSFNRIIVQSLYSLPPTCRLSIRLRRDPGSLQSPGPRQSRSLLRLLVIYKFYTCWYNTKWYEQFFVSIRDLSVDLCVIINLLSDYYEYELTVNSFPVV